MTPAITVRHWLILPDTRGYQQILYDTTGYCMIPVNTVDPERYWRIPQDTSLIPLSTIVIENHDTLGYYVTVWYYDTVAWVCHSLELPTPNWSSLSVLPTLPSAAFRLHCTIDWDCLWKTEIPIPSAWAQHKNSVKMRRRAGVGAIQKKKQNTEKFREKGSELAAVQLQELSSQLGNFQQNLESFAREHKQEIKRDPEFRRHFQVYTGSRAISE